MDALVGIAIIAILVILVIWALIRGGSKGRTDTVGYTLDHAQPPEVHPDFEIITSLPPSPNPPAEAEPPDPGFENPRQWTNANAVCLRTGRSAAMCGCDIHQKVN
ncbi:hypothetical protein AB0I81_63395 [Nonomuraea sp. NPDC050404]|uniref:hypothetical protein n=1 Tax=Nonomuraea sp. NPDC050404 TaxID=3155783 RepID=UPI00340C3414